MTTPRLFSLMTLTATLLAVALSACSPLFSPTHTYQKTPTASADPRFAPFDEPLLPEVTVNDSAQSAGALDSVTGRMPNLSANSVRFVAQYRDDPRDPLGEVGRSYWFHAVITTDPATIDSLLNLPQESSELLPGIVADLRSFVPQDCTFSKVETTAASDLLIGPSIGKPIFGLDEIAVSKNCSMIIVRATGE